MIGQLQDPVFWELFWKNGGKFLLTLIVVVYLLLTGIKIYGHFKNRRNRGTLSSSNRRWINQTTKRRRLFDGMETLETHTERLSSRPDSEGARPVNTNPSILVLRPNEFNGSDRVTINTKGTGEQLRLGKDKLSQTAVSEKPLPHSLSAV